MEPGAFEGLGVSGHSSHVQNVVDAMQVSDPLTYYRLGGSIGR